MKTSNQLCNSFIVFLCLNFNCFAQEQNTKNPNTQIMTEITHLNALHRADKPLSVKVLFKGEEGVTRSLHIKKDGLLPEHTTSMPAILVCVTGKVTYEDESGYQTVLEPGNFQTIEPNIKHWVKGLDDSQLLLMK